MKHMKKGQGLSLNVIIVAALGLLVLVILAVIFVGRTGLFVKDVGSCQGSCVPAELDCQGTYQKVVSGGCDLVGNGKFNDQPGDGVCCITVSS